MKANQFFWFTEAVFIKKEKHHDLVMGANFSGDDFKKQLPDSSFINNYTYQTTGLFLQDDWHIHPKFIAEAGLRWDYHSKFGSFLLPRISLLYKITPYLTTRVGGGLGYKIPTLFSSEIDERDYKLLLPFVSIKPEKSEGINWDINFKKEIADIELTINQSFYITQINLPITALTFSNNQIYFQNQLKPLTTNGFETYIQINFKTADAYLGYTYTVAKKGYDPVQPYLSLSARNKFAAVISNKFAEKVRACIEAAYTGKQYLDNGTITPSYLFAAMMVRYDIHRLTFVLNCENIFDYRQNKTQSIVSGSFSNPVFQQIWAPLDGRVVNLSIQLRL
jgi:outer membrane receptor for ferrienterochelin and colicin